MGNKCSKPRCKSFPMQIQGIRVITVTITLHFAIIVTISINGLVHLTHIPIFARHFECIHGPSNCMTLILILNMKDDAWIYLLVLSYFVITLLRKKFEWQKIFDVLIWRLNILSSWRKYGHQMGRSFRQSWFHLGIPLLGRGWNRLATFKLKKIIPP